MKKIKLLAVLMALVMTVVVVTVCAQPVTASVTDEEAIGFTYSGEDDYEDSTNHCVDWANYTIKQESNYCKDNEVFTGNTYGDHTLNFTAPEDLEIVAFGFTLYHEDPSISLDDYSTFIEMDCETAEDDIWMLKGECVVSSSVPVKKGEPLLTADISFDVANSESFHEDGIQTVVYLSVDWLVVETEDGYKTIVGGGDTTEPVPATSSTAGTTDPVVATTSPTNPTPSVIFGDANGDGAVDILDATLIQKHAAEKVQLTAEQINAADVNKDGVADTLDALLVQKFAAGKITVFA